ncbi:MAG: transposase [Hyphomicrobiales bacterium]|nr:transposase [Hyphomicrobiales bacterium]
MAKQPKMSPKSSSAGKPAEQVVKDIRRATRRHFSAEDKIRIVLDGLRGEESIAELCRKEGMAQSLYYTWTKKFMEAGKRRMAGDTARAVTTDEVRDLRRNAARPAGASGVRTPQRTSRSVASKGSHWRLGCGSNRGIDAEDDSHQSRKRERDCRGPRGHEDAQIEQRIGDPSAREPEHCPHHSAGKRQHGCLREELGKDFRWCRGQYPSWS